MANERFPFHNSDLPLEERIRDVIGRLKTREKLALMLHRSPAIRHLGIPEYN